MIDKRKHSCDCCLLIHDYGRNTVVCYNQCLSIIDEECFVGVVNRVEQFLNPEVNLDRNTKVRKSKVICKKCYFEKIGVENDEIKS